jgi:hypothetical protein
MVKGDHLKVDPLTRLEEAGTGAAPKKKRRMS